MQQRFVLTRAVPFCMYLAVVSSRAVQALSLVGVGW